jgi:hypothetical protein
VLGVVFLLAVPVLGNVYSYVPLGSYDLRKLSERTNNGPIKRRRSLPERTD